MERKDRVVSLRAASAAGRARAAAIATGQILSWQRTIHGGRIRVQQAAPKRRRAGKAPRAAAGGGSVASFFPVVPPSSPGPSSHLSCAGVPSGARAAASAALVARKARVAAALCSVRVERIFRAIDEFGRVVAAAIPARVVGGARIRMRRVRVGQRTERALRLLRPPPPPIPPPPPPPSPLSPSTAGLTAGFDCRFRRRRRQNVTSLRFFFAF